MVPIASRWRELPPWLAPIPGPCVLFFEDPMSAHINTVKVELLHFQRVSAVEGCKHGDQNPEEENGSFAGFLVLITFICGQTFPNPC